MYLNKYNSKLGLILMISDGIYLTGLWFYHSKDNLKFSDEYEYKCLPIFDETIRWLDIYFSGKEPDFTPICKTDYSIFMNSVIDIVKEIPYGTTITYGDIANKLKKDNMKKMSAQAVGHAVGQNIICIIIPCHRVMGKDNKLTGYGGGIENKIKLLEIEHNDVTKYRR